MLVFHVPLTADKDFFSALQGPVCTLWLHSNGILYEETWKPYVSSQTGGTCYECVHREPRYRYGQLSHG